MRSMTLVSLKNRHKRARRTVGFVDDDDLIGQIDVQGFSGIFL